MNLRLRLFLTYAAVIVICLILASVLVTFMLKGYRDRLTQDRLDELARPIVTQTRYASRDQTAIRQYLLLLEQAAQKNGFYILLVDNTGVLIREISPEGLRQPPDLAVSPEELPHGLSKAQQGTFTATTGQMFIYAAYPLRGTAITDLPALDTFILALPRAGALAVWATVFRPILLAGAIALGISLVIAFLLARSVYKPVARITEATRSVALGNYNERVDVKGPQELQELASGFNTMAEEVKRSQQQLRHFVADVSHQLRSPLTSIQGFAQAILDGTAGDEKGKLRAAGIIHDESRRMRAQVDELLELSRLQSGQLKLEKKPVDLNELLAHCCEIYAIQAKDKNIVLACDVAAGLSTIGDADRLEQVFNNLLDNAVKNLQAGGHITLNGSKDGASVRLSVKDDGPGIPQDQIPHVFERFYQVTGMRTGVGLGLAIARGIVLAHEGAIEVKSEPGAGAEFVVILPSGDK
jgi:signal transduction histidine kinase